MELMELAYVAGGFVVVFVLGYLLGNGFSVKNILKKRRNASITDKTSTEEVPLDFIKQRDDLIKSQFNGDDRRRLIVVAKQLPVRCFKDEEGIWRAEWNDARDFLANIRVLNKSMDVIYVGFLGANVPEDEKPEVEALLEQYNCNPVYLRDDLKERFFNGFCKGVLWPLLHYVTPQSKYEFGKRWDQVWQAYTAANMLFAKEVARVAESPNDSIWVHNYHLLLVPSFLRKKLPRAKIGIFIHTPFPSSDVFRMLPARENILRGIMCADLVGFHTYDYARHFLSVCKRVLDIDFETLPGGQMGMKYSGRFVTVIISHVGIESTRFHEMSKSSEVLVKKAQIRNRFKGRKIIVGIDDLDVVKGSLLKLQAFERFLATHPEWRKKVVLVQVILPSSTSPQEKKIVRDRMWGVIDQIRSQFGEDVIEAIEMNSITLQDTIAYYSASEVAIVSTFFDGLNLAPYEYTAVQDPQEPGALIISEFMGCSRSLSGVIRVNPWGLEGVSDALHSAVSMSLAERRANHKRRSKYVMNSTLERWAVNFIYNLEQATRFSADLSFVQVGWGSNVRLVGLRADFTHLEESFLTAAYRRCSKRILLFDYDGTLTPTDGTDGLHSPSAAMLKTLETLAANEENYVFILSGRQRKELGKWFKDLPELGIAAEKGCFVKWPQRSKSARRLNQKKLEDGKSKDKLEASVPQDADDCITARMHKPSEDAIYRGWETLCPVDDVTWIKVAGEIMKSYAEHTDGSWVEDKEFALVWHYENADPTYGRMQANELAKYLIKVIDNPQIDVVRYDYNRILEVKPRGISKGLTTARILKEVLGKDSAAEDTFLLCIGDDRSDEDMFITLQERPDLNSSFKEPAVDSLRPRRQSMRTIGPEKSNTFTVCVGIKPTNAHFYVHDDEEVSQVLQALAHCTTRMNSFQNRKETDTDDLDEMEPAIKKKQ